MKVLKVFFVLAVLTLVFCAGGEFQYYVLDETVIQNQKEVIDAQQTVIDAQQIKWNDYFDYSSNPMDISVEQAYLWLDRAAHSHEHHLFDDDFSNDEFHQGCIDRYASIKNLIMKLASGQATFEPQVIVETETIYEVVEKVVIKEVPIKLRDFDSLEELEEWLAEIPIQIQFDGNWDCENYALGLQQKALKGGYLMSFEAIWHTEYNELFKETQLPTDEIHAINSVIIGNDVYYIEPQTKEVALAGCLD